MTRQDIAIGASANDGTGDTLRSAGTKINANFVELYQRIGGDSDDLSQQVSFEDSAVVFEGASTNNFETRLTADDPSADRQLRLPNASGIVTVNEATQTLTNKTITEPVIYRPIVQQSINDSSDNEIIKFTRTASAVNEVTVTNAAASGAPSLTSTGTDTNVNLTVKGKGTGSVFLGKSAVESNEISADGDASDLHTYIICNKGTALAVGLNDGTTVGELRYFTNKGAGVATITPDNFAGGTSFAIAQNEAATCIWDGSNWFLVGNQSVTTVV
jgi:hypothetical protein